MESNKNQRIFVKSIKMKKSVTLFLISLCIWASSHAQTIDSGKSSVSFEVSNMAFKTVSGSFSGMKGKIKFDPKSISSSSFEVCIDAASVNTENKKRDDHLRNEDFFEVDRFPTICFRSKEIKKEEEGFRTRGVLTIHGVTREVVIPFSFSKGELVGQLTIDRNDFGVGDGYGSFMVGNEVHIMIKCVLDPDSI